VDKEVSAPGEDAVMGRGNSAEEEDDDDDAAFRLFAVVDAVRFADVSPPGVTSIRSSLPWSARGREEEVGLLPKPTISKTTTRQATEAAAARRNRLAGWLGNGRIVREYRDDQSGDCLLVACWTRTMMACPLFSCRVRLQAEAGARRPPTQKGEGVERRSNEKACDVRNRRARVDVLASGSSRVRKKVGFTNKSQNGSTLQLAPPSCLSRGISLVEVTIAAQEQVPLAFPTSQPVASFDSFIAATMSYDSSLDYGDGDHDQQSQLDDDGDYFHFPGYWTSDDDDEDDGSKLSAARCDLRDHRMIRVEHESQIQSMVNDDLKKLTRDISAMREMDSLQVAILKSVQANSVLTRFTCHLWDLSSEDVENLGPYIEALLSNNSTLECFGCSCYSDSGLQVTTKAVKYAIRGACHNRRLLGVELGSSSRTRQ
jgi:hypothetical protein